jgi:ribulose-5-phosphate 4-epimerase/fuculose-1-phosphate aldolase
VLANHGPVVAAGNIQAAVYAIEELEETARLALITRGMNPRVLSEAQIEDVVAAYGLEWD